MGSVEKQGIGNAWPVGCGFRPTDDELINYYFKRKLRGLEEARLMIPELNIYQWEPQTLFEKYNVMADYPSDGGECFFYCTRGGKNRKTPAGFWKETRGNHTFWGCDGEEIGSKRILVYQKGRQPYGKKTSFSLHEYHLNSCTKPIGADKGPATEFVLCRIINRNIRKIKPSSPSEFLEPDLVTPGGTAVNQRDKDREAIPQVCEPLQKLTETEAEADGHGDSSEIELQQFYESMCSETHQFTYNDHINGSLCLRDDDHDDRIFISDLWN